MDLAEVGVPDPINVVVPPSGVDVWFSSFLVDALENGLRKLNWLVFPDLQWTSLEKTRAREKRVCQANHILVGQILAKLAPKAFGLVESL
jgi:hypothetical protein